MNDKLEALDNDFPDLALIPTFTDNSYVAPATKGVEYLSTLVQQGT
jgi:hypothetical protein